MNRRMLPARCARRRRSPSLSSPSGGSASAEALRDQWCKDVKIRFFVGGAEGDGFGVIVYNGAVQAAHDTGAQVEYVFSGWKSEKMVQQLREAVASAPDGIAMMGHPGDAPIMPLAEEAAKAGIKMMYQNVDVPEVRAKRSAAAMSAPSSSRRATPSAPRRSAASASKAGDKAIVVGQLRRHQPRRSARPPP